jgi:hypothetical protein
MTEDPLNHGRVFDQRDQTQTFSATCCSAKYGPRAAEPVFRKATPGKSWTMCRIVFRGDVHDEIVRPRFRAPHLSRSNAR